jgi:hypothetical protein
MTTQMKSLYDRLGGLEAINALTESWVARVGGDDRANGKFARTDIPRLKKEVADQLCEAAGGPCAYTGRSMRETQVARLIDPFGTTSQAVRSSGYADPAARPLVLGSLLGAVAGLRRRRHSAVPASTAVAMAAADAMSQARARGPV